MEIKADIFPTAEEMKLCATADIDENRIIENYWSEGTFEAEVMHDDLYQQWFSTQLCAMGEPQLSSNEGLRIRFLWLRSFHPGISIRIEHTDSITQIISTELSGAGGYSPGEVSRKLTRSLTIDEWNRVDELINSIELWNISTRTSSDVIGADGAEWLVEIIEPHRRHIVLRWSGEEIESLGKLLIDLSQLVPYPIY